MISPNATNKDFCNTPPTKKLPHGASVIFDNLCCRGVARNAQFVKVCVYSQGVACYAPTENIIFVSLCTFEMY